MELQKRYFVIKTIIREGGGIRTSVYGLATYMKLLGAMNWCPLLWIFKSSISTPVACLSCVLGVPMVKKTKARHPSLRLQICNDDNDDGEGDRKTKE